MATNDWLVGRNRHDEAARRIYAAAARLMSRHGYDAFNIDALAAAVHCSPATIYRHTGGKAAIRDTVLGLQALPDSECVDPILKLAGVDQGSDDVVVEVAESQGDAA